jgi:uncharacterized protein YybS (DUF2232 family)
MKNGVYMRGEAVKNSKAITEGALVLAIFMTMIVISVYFPFIYIIVHLLLPLPILIYSVKHSSKASLLLVVASILATTFIGLWAFIPITLAYSAAGFAMGICIKKGKSNIQLYISISLIFLMNIVLLYVTSNVIFKIDIIEDAMNTFQASFEQSVAMLESMGQTMDGTLQDRVNDMFSLIQTLTPSLIVVLAFLSALPVVLVNLPIAKRLGMKVRKWEPFRNWCLPKSLLWYYLITLLISLLFKMEEGTYLFAALVNISFVLQLLMFIQGISFIYFYSNWKKWSKTIPIIATLLSMLLFPFIRILGIIDLGFDLRQRLGKNR